MGTYPVPLPSIEATGGERKAAAAKPPTASHFPSACNLCAVSLILAWGSL